MTPALDLRYIQLPLPEAVRSERELSPYEKAELHTSTDHRRRAGWIAGRWLIKHLLRERLNDVERQKFVPTAVSILSRDTEGRPCRPSILYRERPLPMSVSVSHTSRGVLVGLSRRDGLLLGVDLAQPERVGLGALDPWYTQQERQWIHEQHDPTAAAQLWTIKQAFFKAANRGEMFSPRRVSVTTDADGRFQCTYSHRSHDLPAYIAVTTCDQQVAALVVILPAQTLEEVPETYDSVIPQSELIRIGRPW
jgi:phosphopantetheinyl transferase